MTPDQITLALYICTKCGIELEYRGYGRPPRWCDEHYPSRAPRRKPLRSHEVPASRRTDPDTSRQAPKYVDGKALAERILDAYARSGPLTAFECAVLLNDYLEATVRSAVGRMHTDGLLVDTGTRRPSPRGRASMVLRKATGA